jgi:uncharacterized membrane protein
MKWGKKKRKKKNKEPMSFGEVIIYIVMWAFILAIFPAFLFCLLTLLTAKSSHAQNHL